MNKSPVCLEIPGIHHYIYIVSSIMNKSPVCLVPASVSQYRSISNNAENFLINTKNAIS